MAESFMSSIIPEEKGPTILSKNIKSGTKKKENTTEKDLSVFVNHIKKLEGKKLTAYKPVNTEEHYTVGYGHYGPDVKKGMTITDEQAESYLKKDIEKRLVTIKKAIPNFDNMPIDTRKHLLDSWFRGGLSGSPKTIYLINQENYAEASTEFLDNNEYKNTKLTGVKKRMEATSQAIARLEI